MTMPEVLRTRQGRHFVVVGDTGLLTMDRIAEFTAASTPIRGSRR